ncbi:hypothetical protein NQ318_016771 [Aromia moschata]|uniref:HTH CENPB-type domain-containing protein n=1 Tax=Aromia moschata TaxID=1265417 RepID=A0AAV8Y3C5_9CUCU|nr:hypothetical protein NQ318_016771 [Aromia moschata]
MSQLNVKINVERRVIKRLSIAEKLQVIEDFKNGMKNKDLSEKYKVHHSAISKIIYNKDKILEHKETIEKYGANKNVLRYSSVRDSLFERCTFLWFSQKRALGEPVTGPLLQAKAKQFHASLNVDSNFSASSGWLARFKKRYGIRCLNIKGEKLSANEDDASVFREELNALLNSNNNRDSDEESPNLPPPSLDEVLQSILQIRHWSRGKKIVTVKENRSLDNLMEKILQLKNKYSVN